MISVPLWVLVLLSCMSIPFALLVLMLIIGLITNVCSGLIQKHKTKNNCPYKVEKEN